MGGRRWDVPTNVVLAEGRIPMAGSGAEGGGEEGPAPPVRRLHLGGEGGQGAVPAPGSAAAALGQIRRRPGGAGRGGGREGAAR